jgi:hypothetical protein
MLVRRTPVPCATEPERLERPQVGSVPPASFGQRTAGLLSGHPARWLLLLVLAGAVTILVIRRRRNTAASQRPATSPDPEPWELIDTADAAALLGQPQEQIDVLVSDGLLTPVQQQGRRCFRAAEVRALRMAGG